MPRTHEREPFVSQLHPVSQFAVSFNPRHLLISLFVLGSLLFWAWRHGGLSPIVGIRNPRMAQDSQEAIASAVSLPSAPKTSSPDYSVPDQPLPLPPRFNLPTDPKLLSLRKLLLQPWREVQTEGDAARQQTAMADLYRLRTPEAANLLAELLFADKATYYDIDYVNGQEEMTVSYSVMIYLYKMLENAPMPVDGQIFGDADLPVWQAWWHANHDKLVFRDPKKPLPVPPGLRK
jgi:hypothetical protein